MCAYKRTICYNNSSMNNENDVIEIDLLHILEVLLSRVWTIIITGALGATILFVFSAFFITPMYKSSAMFYVNNNNLNIGSSSFSISSSDISASQSLVDTYIVILKTRNTLETVIEKSNMDLTYKELSEMVSASAVNSTEVFEVSVTTTDPVDACTIANTIADVLPDKISEIVTGSGAKVVDYAVVNAQKVSPSIKKYTAIGLLVGALLACVVIVLQDIFDDTIRDENYLISTYDEIPNLAVIPNLEEKNSNHYSNNYYSNYGYYSKPTKENKKEEDKK